MSSQTQSDGNSNSSNIPETILRQYLVPMSAAIEAQWKAWGARVSWEYRERLRRGGVATTVLCARTLAPVHAAMVVKAPPMGRRERGRVRMMKEAGYANPTTIGGE